MPALGLGRLNVQLVADTDAPDVIHAIERAAETAGIELERVDGPGMVHEDRP